MDFANIRFEISPAEVATVTIDRPDNLNALNFATLDELKAALDQAVARRARCLLLTGAGRFVDDERRDGALVMAVLRSPVAHGGLRERQHARPAADPAAAPGPSAGRSVRGSRPSGPS